MKNTHKNISSEYNFLSSHQQTEKPKHPLRTSRKKTFLKRALVVVLVIIVGMGILLFTNYDDARAAYQSALRGQQYILEAQKLVEEQNFTDATAKLLSAHEEFSRALTNTQALSEFKIVPLAGTQLRATENILTTGQQLSSALAKFTKLGDEILAVFQEDKDISLKEITPEQRTMILKKMYESPPELAGAKAELDLAILSMRNVPEYGVLSPIRKAADSIEEKLPIIQDVIDQALPAMKTLPQVVGYPSSKTYLFLLQNNTELRPTGGFIGTYGIMKMENGDIRSFQTDNIYNLDDQVKDTLHISPPWQVAKYLNAGQLFLRDSNWAPDFPTSAKLAEDLYHQEGGVEQNLDGVISVTPTFIESLLKLTGPITVDGVTFTSDNFVETLEYQVEQGFYKQGISTSERKEVIGDLASTLMDKLMSLPKEHWKDLWTTFEKDVDEKQILIFMQDEYLQNLAKEQGWAGEIRTANNDFLMFVDSNFASLKTDPGVKRTVTYDLRDDPDKGLVATASIHYKNEGAFNWKTTRYRTYVRLYVPEGSVLLSSSGAMENDKLHGGKPGEVETVAEFGKTRFGAFIAIEPQEEGTLAFSYTLPERLRDELNQQKKYSLLVQKQAGTIAHNFQFHFDVGKRIESVSPLDKAVVNGDNGVDFSSDLRLDREFEIRFK